MRRKLAASALLILMLAACHKADPLARARSDCANEAAASSTRQTACGALIASGALTAEDQAAALANRGNAHFAVGETTSALRDYAAALALDDDNIPATAGRARILIASGQLDAAEPLVERLVSSGQLGADAHFMQGQIAAQRGDGASAITAFDAAIAENAEDAPAFSARARVKQQQGDLDGAMVDFNRAVELDSNLADAHSGRCWLRLKQADGVPQMDDGPALEDAAAAVQAAPHNYDANVCRGIFQLRTHDWIPARASFEAALGEQPGSPVALFGRGVARRRAGDGAGVSDMNQARDFDGHIGERFDHFGVATY